jgi:hypothetical protein
VLGVAAADLVGLVGLGRLDGPDRAGASEVSLNRFGSSGEYSRGDRLVLSMFSMSTSVPAETTIVGSAKPSTSSLTRGNPTMPPVASPGILTSPTASRKTALCGRGS